MRTATILLIILAALLAVSLVLFQYYYKSKQRGNHIIFLAFFRFLAIFGFLLLLINPQFSRNEYAIEKTTLVLLSDNSTSMRPYANVISDIKQEFDNTRLLEERFVVEHYGFGNALNVSDSLHLDESNTNISKALSAIAEIYSNTNVAVVLVTDGNQTIGENYTYNSKKLNLPVYPVAVGDTTTYEDIRVVEVNVNKYAFLKNKFPVEATIVYNGQNSITSELVITLNGKAVYREDISLSATTNTKTITALLEARSVGVKSLQIGIAPLQNEKNEVNNKRRATIEVIDEKTNVMIVSSLTHPDIGALKKAIESNEQRSVTIVKPTAPVTDFADVDILVLYQPDASFKRVYTYGTDAGVNRLTVTGEKTDWDFLNSVQGNFFKNSYDQSEEVFPTLNNGFGIFNIVDFSIEDFPPLTANLGEIEIYPSHENILSQKIKGVDLDQPLLTLINDDMGKEAILFGEGIWKWRVQSFRNSQDFTNFDTFIGKLVFYLASTKAKTRLDVGYESIYEGKQNAQITATFFDETFVFEPNATISLKITGKEVSKEIPMVVKGSFYEADISDLPEGEYSFTATVKNENISKSGSFTIASFDIEQQFSVTNADDLNQLAGNTGGNLYFPSQTKELLSTLNSDKRFVPTQKSKENIVSLIDFKILLGIIAAALSLEWFTRKYYGLI